jgi:hypothetical protein
MSEDINQDLNREKEPRQKIVTVDKTVLKGIIIEWLALDDQIKSYRDIMKEMTEEKRQFEAQIIDLMTELKQDMILTDKGNITRNVKEMKGPLTPELIKTTLSDLLKCPETADTYTNQIMEKRTKKEIIGLKRKEIKTKKNKK